MKHTIKKQFWLNSVEAESLRSKANRASMTEAALIRSLILGYEPKEKPDDEFYKMMRGIINIGGILNQIAAKMNSTGEIQPLEIRKQISKLNDLQLLIEEKYLLPEASKYGDN